MENTLKMNASKLFEEAIKMTMRKSIRSLASICETFFALLLKNNIEMPSILTFGNDPAVVMPPNCNLW